MESELDKFIVNKEGSELYFGLMITSYDDGTPYLEIKDHYD